MAARARPRASTGAGAVVLVGGHETDFAGALDAALGPVGPPTAVSRTGRPLERALDDARRSGDPALPVVVVPMTVGRDPRLVSDAARTVRWAGRAGAGRRIALAAPLGTADHLVGWLRAACRQVPPDAAVVLAGRASDAFDDAELHRVAALVRAYGRSGLVEVGLRGADGGLDTARERCRRLGADRVAIVAADLSDAPDVDVRLLSPAAARQVVAARVATACHRLLDHGDDGIAAAHAADHSRGFAHTHDHHHTHAG